MAGFERDGVDHHMVGPTGELDETVGHCFSSRPHDVEFPQILVPTERQLKYYWLTWVTSDTRWVIRPLYQHMNQPTRRPRLTRMPYNYIIQRAYSGAGRQWRWPKRGASKNCLECRLSPLLLRLCVIERANSGCPPGGRPIPCLNLGL